MINTDFIDNSAGVNTSDLEVNLKILFKLAIDDGVLAVKERNPLIKRLSKSVSDMVLWNNFLQNTLIDLAIYEAGPLLNQYVRFMDLLEQKEF